MKSPKLELSMSLNHSFGFVRAWIKPKCSFRLNKDYSFGLFNYFKSYNPSKYGYNHKRASSLHGFGGIIIIFLFFCLKGGFPTLPWDFSTLLHNDPAAHQNNCGRCRIRTRNLFPEVWCATFEPSHLQMSNHKQIFTICPKARWIWNPTLQNNYLG